MYDVHVDAHEHVHVLKYFVHVNFRVHFHVGAHVHVHVHVHADLDVNEHLPLHILGTCCACTGIFMHSSELFGLRKRYILCFRFPVAGLVEVLFVGCSYRVPWISGVGVGGGGGAGPIFGQGL
jgi:hypothetical protein